ncbi:methylenetetrahydrofolate--tRNA-(uracil(54)-C(5))-methyltransferase (FADH(2)-oxidizing) TrmFO [Eubacterium coprostanoligenes]|uniref:methylenetetrahydrofolate--tRNA-(uracil(54)- C(5))-methyltransferase (FADH(2)-oxidizing) TrmFO n=1 Tax=Eubacterium coprostanoligenes TaxID=290054 RepID=UPI002351FB1A|nr:methylenetetrahydrofolate--tRNA-(uracil(54)-C(5))-methyltransferase (FADH(2)-oxidizing) TrmFO [Eubacterium coprostanoligenes]MCI6253267.1 methylenetetrahydrofolate--tRNA-(uracil(54)-C(5))-methyltransferase (FADH(2)-oxidizing) TrmFO [Eubacterium coprostanoligenes]MDY5400387.1 methylenetetrahydrofolate--tRNA-(uracil(54)-C(5))-methyltransferase (FADH(2)-oxidizing) TrmFO [Eubacterium coprostanoligenes]
MKKFTVIGAGLAGCEAAWQIAEAGYEVTLLEMKPEKFSPAHKNKNFAELVCSNSLKASRIDSAAGLLKEEMARLGSLTVPVARNCAVPAGGALAVDRNEFSQTVTDMINSHPNITVENKLVEEISLDDDEILIIATGPLTEGKLGEAIQNLCGDYLSFYDAAAPIVMADSVDMQKAFGASRYDRGGDDDYINCPFNKAEYEAFIDELVNAEGTVVHDFDVYEGCMPIEKLAKRGLDAPRFGPMKPVGLVDPNTGHRPWACVQLRRENSKGTMFNLVGFQTNLKFGEQKRVFSMIPGLENAEFVRYGVMHRNSFLNSPKLLNSDFSLRSNPNIFFAGQITGVEGYMESAASGIMAGINAVRRAEGEEPLVLSEYNMIGALSQYISDESVTNFQPMGANFGVLPPIEPKIRDKRERYMALANRALEQL